MPADARTSFNMELPLFSWPIVIGLMIRHVRLSLLGLVGWPKLYLSTTWDL